MAASVGGVTVNFTAQTAQFVEGVKRVEGQLAGFGNSLKRFQARMRTFNRAASLLRGAGALAGVAAVAHTVGQMARAYSNAQEEIAKGSLAVFDFGGAAAYTTQMMLRAVPVFGEAFGSFSDAIGDAIYNTSALRVEFEKVQAEAAAFAKSQKMAKQIGRDTELMRIETSIAFGDAGQGKARQAAVDTMRQLDAIAEKQRKLGEEASKGGPGGNSVAINKAMADLELQKQLVTAQGAKRVSDLVGSSGSIDQVISGRFSIGTTSDKRTPIIGDPEQTNYLKQIAEGVMRPPPALAK
jgi:hypothetical protein